MSPCLRVATNVIRMNEDSKPVILVDIDGTLADVRHRLHHIKGAGRKNWKAFFAAMDGDTPMDETIRWVRELEKDNHIVVLTGRPEEYRARTERWLRDHGVPFEKLVMRPQGDHRPDYVVKAEVLRDIPRERIALVIEDRDQVCAMWESKGVKVHQVASDEDNQQVNEAYRREFGKHGASD